MLQDLFNKKKIHQLEKSLEYHIDEYKKLSNGYTDLLNTYAQTISERDNLKEQLNETKLSFPTSKFNIAKAVDLLTTSLSDKALAKFCHDFTIKLAKTKYSHLVSLNTYVLKQLTKY